MILDDSKFIQIAHPSGGYQPNNSSPELSQPPNNKSGLPPQSTYHETVTKTIVDENQKIQDENKLLKTKLRQKEEECQIVRGMYHDCYNDYRALINAIKIINSVIKKSESSLSK